MLFAFRNTLIANITGLAQAALGKPESFEDAIGPDAQPYTDLILQVASEKGVDPFLIAAIGQKESRWGRALKPTGPAGTGDFTPRSGRMPDDGLGWGRGLMQLDYNVYGNTVNWADPLTNIREGAQHILDSVKFFSKTPSTTVDLDSKQAARRGIGAGSYPDPRPLVGNALTDAVVAAYNTGNTNVLMNLAAGQRPDLTTTGGYYGANVISQALQWAQRFV